jgi:uncharacterized protein
VLSIPRQAAWADMSAWMPALLPMELTGFEAVEAGLAIWMLAWTGARHAYPSLDLMSLLRRLRFGWRAWRSRAQWSALREAPAGSPLGQLMRARTGMLHLVAWPYLHNGWSVAERVDTVVSHYRQIERWRWLQVPLGRRAVLARLGDDTAPLTLQLDRPAWFAQEGELALSLFDGDGQTRLYAVVFSFGQREGRPALFVGAIQGRSLPCITDRYVELTRQLHGCRPRDLIVLALLAIARELGFEVVYAVSDACRHHRDPLRLRPLHLPSAHYDDVWRDRGGVPAGDGFFLLPTAAEPRAEASVPSRKRAMYRRRYELLGGVWNTLHTLAQNNQLPTDLRDGPGR